MLFPEGSAFRVLCEAGHLLPAHSVTIRGHDLTLEGLSVPLGMEGSFFLEASMKTSLAKLNLLTFAPRPASLVECVVQLANTSATHFALRMRANGEIAQ